MPGFALPLEKLQLDNVSFNDLHPRASDKRSEILSGLQQRQKFIDPKYFYDIRGSKLFERITGLPEYYPTRTERQILKHNSKSIGADCGKNCVLIEPGSGSSEKVRLLLDTLKPAAYVPMDISTDFLRQSATRLANEYPWLTVHAICADFANLEKVPDGLPAGRRVIFYPGSTLGNMNPADASLFLRNLGRWLNRDGGVLIGIDMHKSARVLEGAYNDAEGVTALFNLNILNNINGLLKTDFDVSRFEHRAFYNEKKYRIEMHLVSKVDQIIRLNETEIGFARGETIHTENSYKYTREGFEKLARGSGFVIRSCWSDEQELFGVYYLELDETRGRDHQEKS